jgi:polyisoprenoid-binding protein YceI
MTQWIIDPDHSVAAFSIHHMGIAMVHGQLNKMTGAFVYDPADPASLSLEAQIEAAGIYTGIGKRDEHLRSPDFLDVEKYPVISYKSSGFEPREVNKGRLAGMLTLHGITRPVDFDVEIFGPVKSPEEIGGETTIAISAHFSLNREDYGMKWNVLLDDGTVMVAREVGIDLNIEGDLAG